MLSTLEPRFSCFDNSSCKQTYKRLQLNTLKVNIYCSYFLAVIQFGFVTMFVASFPLAPLFALLNNFVETRADAINFVVNYRRRVSEQVKDIGIWYKILEIVTKISVVVNSFVIAFTTDFIPR